MNVICPVSMCRVENNPEAEICVHCGTPLRGYVSLSTYPARLFNLGLSAARRGEVGRARDLFAAVVHWCPMDVEARNALGMACFALGDQTEARRHWETVLARAPADGLATRGLAEIASLTRSSETSIAKQRSKDSFKKKRGRSSRH